MADKSPPDQPPIPLQYAKPEQRRRSYDVEVGLGVAFLMTLTVIGGVAVFLLTNLPPGKPAHWTPVVIYAAVAMLGWAWILYSLRRFKYVWQAALLGLGLGVLLLGMCGR